MTAIMTGLAATTIPTIPSLGATELLANRDWHKSMQSKREERVRLVNAPARDTF